MLNKKRRTTLWVFAFFALLKAAAAQAAILKHLPLWLLYCKATAPLFAAQPAKVFSKAFFKKTGEAPPARPRRGGSDSGKARGHQARRFP